MRTDVPAFSDPTLQSRAGVTVTLYPSASPRDLIVGTAGLAARDLTPYATRITHTATEASITLVWHSELDGGARPQAGQMVRIALGSYAVFTGHIDAISGDHMARTGGKTCTVTVRRRDATAWWRDVRRVTQIYTAGVDLAALARDVATNLGLQSDEYDIPDIGITLAHESAQLADLNGWDMLEIALQPGLRVPLVDGRGVLKSVNRNLLRDPDLIVPFAQVKDVDNGLARPPLATMRVKWLDPILARVDQQYQPLTRSPALVTIGFFHPKAVVDLYWSEERTQRADNTALHILESPRLSFWGSNISSSYEQISQFQGRITVSLDAVVTVEELVADIALIAAGHYLQAIPIVGALVGGAAESIAIADVLRVLTQVAVGAYEVQGVPFDMIHAVNESEAYDQDAEEWRQQLEELQNDLIPNEQIADSLAVNELIYRARSASRASITIADDLRIEPNDLVGLEDARRLFVTDLSRDLTRGAEAVVKLEGFFV